VEPPAHREPSGPIEGRWERTPVEGQPPYVRTEVHVERPCVPYVAGPGQQPRCAENRGGDFYTACDLCVTCDIPHAKAPNLMAYVVHPDSTHCVFTRQPRTPEEVESAIDAMCNSEVCGIRYGGTDPEILRRVASRWPSGEGTTDHPRKRGRRA
jgi:hypothetical protein